MSPIALSLALFLSLIVSWPVFAQNDFHCHDTNIVRPLRIPIKTLQDTLNRDTPSSMSGREGIDISGVTGEHVWWSMSRSPINLSTSDNRVRANTTISGKVRVRGKVRPLGPNFSVGPNLMVGASLSIQPVLKDDWRLHPNVKASARVTRARINTPVGSISVRTQSQRAVNKLLRRTVDQINEEFEKSEFLQREGQRLWEDLHRKFELSKEPHIWLVMRPTHIKATSLSSNDDGIAFGISVGAETETSFGDEPPSPTPKELPPLQVLDELPKGKIELALQTISSGWETLNGLIGNSLENNSIGYEGSSGRLTLTDIKLAAKPEESVESLLVTTTILVEPSGWPGRALRYFDLTEVLDKQTIKMSAEPVVSEDGRSVGLENAQLLQSSSELVNTVADSYSWLTDEMIEDLIERHAAADLSAHLDEVKKDAQVKVNEFAKKLDENGLPLIVKTPPMPRFASVSVRPEGLVAKVCAAADTSTIHVALQ